MGFYLSQPKTEKFTRSGQNSKLSYAASSMQGWRLNMEDADITALDFDQDIHVFGVFDGHGGQEVAIYVERHFLFELKANQNFQKGNFEEALKETFQRMDDLIISPEGRKELSEIRMSTKDNEREDNSEDQGTMESMAGCTANVAIIADKTLYVANAGDSRCVLFRNGQMFEMSIDHKPDQQIEKDRIVKAGGGVYDGRVNGNLNLSRAIGDMEYKKNADLRPEEQLIINLPDVKKIELGDEDEFMVLGCDGIWELKSGFEICSFIKQQISKKPLKVICENLLDQLIAPDTAAGYGLDNMTLIIVNLKPHTLESDQDS